MPRLHFRSIWISDLHLGTQNLENEQLLDFLQQSESEFLYLVGDIFDLLQAQKKWHWPQVNDRIVKTILEKAENGTKVFYLPGNHDHMLRKFDGSTFNNIHIQNQVIHETVDGHRYLVLHGDTFDPVVQHCPWLASIGSTIYEILLIINSRLNLKRRQTHRKQWSFSAWMKHRVKIAVNVLGRFEKVVVRKAVEHQVEGLICGHIHRAGIREIENMLYTNAGDWVESCTALAENHTGQLGIVEWRNQYPLEEAVAVKNYEDLYRNRCLASPN
jgi:UDP-2,3-diacylglucosamine pyrophosphatase LpxH